MLLVDVWASVLFGENPLQRWVLALYRHHGVVDELADLRLLGVGLQVAPARLARHPEDVLGQVLVAIFRVDAADPAFAQRLGVLALGSGLLRRLLPLRFRLSDQRLVLLRADLLEPQRLALNPLNRQEPARDLL